MSTRAGEEAELARWRLLPGNIYRRWFDTMIATEFAAPEAIAAWQDRRLRQILDFAGKHVPFYRDRFAALGLQTAGIRGQQDLPQLPILTKQEVLENFEALQARGLPGDQGPLKVFRSSGTTGRPVKVVMSRPSAVMFSILAHRRRRWARVDPKGVVCAIRIPSHFPHKDGAPLPNGELLQVDRWFYLGNHFETGPAYGFNVWNPMARQLAWLREIQPRYLETYPATFEELAFANGGTSPAASIAALFSNASGAAPSTRRQVERMFRAPLHDAYGLNEIGAVATRCEAGAYHIHAEHCVVEVVDAEGRPCAIGRMGRVLVTALQNLAMPLVRYDTGDVARAAGLPCDCGRNLPVVAEIGGRFRRFAYLPEGTRERHFILLDAIEATPVELLNPLRQYQLFQYRDHSFELRVRSEGGMAPEFGHRLLDVWGRIPGTERTPLRIVEVKEIPASPSGKQLEFDSEFYPAPDAEIDPKVYRAGLERLEQES